MISKKMLIFAGVVALLAALPVMGAQGILVVKFDCQGTIRGLGDALSDSLKANLKIQQIPAVPDSKWQALLDRNGYSENDMNYNPSILALFAKQLNAEGAVYGQVYEKNGLLIMDAYYIEPGFDKPIDFDPMIGNTNEDILEMTWDLALHLAHPDKVKPSVVKIEPGDSSAIDTERLAFKVYFDEPMNPDSYGLTGEPKDMFFTFGDVAYDPSDYSFTFNVHLYPQTAYRFWVNGPGLKPFMDTTGNVANDYEWSITTK